MQIHSGCRVESGMELWDNDPDALTKVLIVVTSTLFVIFYKVGLDTFKPPVPFINKIAKSKSPEYTPRSKQEASTSWLL